MRTLALAWLGINAAFVGYTMVRYWTKRAQMDRAINMLNDARWAAYERAERERAELERILRALPVVVSEYDVWVGSQDPHVVAEYIARSPVFIRQKVA